MKTAVLLLAAASAALAQNFEGQPPCATDCLSSAISAAGCDVDDMGCQCGPTQAAIAASAAPCLIESCTGTLILDAQSAGAAQCSSYSETAADVTATTTTATDESTETSTVTDEMTTTMTDDEDSQTTEEPNPDETGGGNNDATTTTDSTAGAAAAATPIVGAGALLGVLGAIAAM